MDGSCRAFRYCCSRNHWEGRMTSPQEREQRTGAVPKQRARHNGFVFFETFVIVSVVSIFAYLQTLDHVKSDRWLHIALIGMQILASAYAGHKIFPKVFVNEELVSFQKIMLGRIITILRSGSKDILTFELRELVSQTVGNIDSKVTTEFVRQQDRNMRSFFDAGEGTIIVDAHKIENRIHEAISTEESRLLGERSDESRSG